MNLSLKSIGAAAILACVLMGGCKDQAPRAYTAAGTWIGAKPDGLTVDSLVITLAQDSTAPTPVSGSGYFRDGPDANHYAFTLTGTLIDGNLYLNASGTVFSGGLLTAKFGVSESNADQFTVAFTTNCCSNSSAAFTWQFDGVLRR